MAGRPPHRWERFRRLVRYYLECVQEDRRQEICFKRDGARPGYAVLDLLREWSLLEGLDAERPATADTAQLLSATRLRGQSAQLFYGYPVLSSASDGKAELLPLFIQPVEAGPARLPGRMGVTLRLVPDWPRVNREAFRRLFGATADQDLVLEELGLRDESPDVPSVRIGDAVRRLAGMELPQPLPLLEPLDPDKLSKGRYGGAAKGLLNRAIVFAAEPSRYTKGLERELTELATARDAVLDGTALAPLFAEGWGGGSDPTERPFYEVRGLNDEQRSACQTAQRAALTVVTGPPGTGKSQVVINVLANAFLQGRPVIFSSRNHKAVTVVEERLNRLVESPILLQLGSSGGLGERLAQVLTQILSAQSRPESAARLKKLPEEYASEVSTRDAIAQSIEEVRSARNAADQLDRAFEPWRRKLGEDELADVERATRAPDLVALEAAVRVLERYAPGRNGSQGLIAAVLRFFQLPRVERTLKDLKDVYPVLGLLPERAPRLGHLDTWLAYAERAAALAAASQDLNRYRNARERLAALGPIDVLSEEWSERRNQVWTKGRELLDLHRSELGARLSPSDRAAAGRALAIARALAGLDPGTMDAWRLRKQIQEELPALERFLPVWAVTNLSAPGAIPPSAGMFDLAVIDEASQCDIPSAIPLLFRSKRAVIIGDPQQLRHVTTLPLARESQLAARHKLTEAADQPFRFVTNSLFDLAAASALAEVVALREHFRSHADIVGFSNAHWYRKDLRVLTDCCALVTPGDEPPGIRWTEIASRIFRPDGGGAIAPEEAVRTAEEVATVLGAKGFAGSVGVVTPFRAQANRIREELHSRLPPGAMERIQLVADTAHGFQGDERDVMVFSPCLGTPMPPGARKFLAKTANVFNVAVTRARAQLRVVGDLHACELSGIPHVEAFAQHVRRLRDEATRPAHPSIGVFERPLAEALRDQGVETIPQYAVGAYRLDLAVVRDGQRVDIEVDGEHFHTDLDGARCREDLARDRYLAQRGWKVRRFWALEVRDHPDRCVDRVLEVLAQKRSAP